MPTPSTDSLKDLDAPHRTYLFHACVLAAPATYGETERAGQPQRSTGPLYLDRNGVTALD